MRTIISTFLILLIIFTGCSSTHFIPQNSLSYKNLNQKLDSRPATIVLANCRKINGENINVHLDSTSWTELVSKSRQIVPTTEIREIIIKDHGRGVGQGFFSGIICSGAAGLLIGLLLTIDPPEGSDIEIVRIVFPCIGGGTGGILGFIIGASKGHKYKFVLSDPKGSNSK